MQTRDERTPVGGRSDRPLSLREWREPAVALDVLPLPSLVLAADGSAIAVNHEWTLLSAVTGEAPGQDGWLAVVEPLDREPLRSLLTGAVAAGEPGSADFRLAGANGGRLSRWWWRPGVPGQLVVCVADLGHLPGGSEQRPRAITEACRAVHPASPAEQTGTSDSGASYAASTAAPAGPDNPMGVLTILVHRLFDVGLVLESASDLTDGPVAARLQEAADELDTVIRDVRTAVFASRLRLGLRED
jgi:hypothetical protein